MKTKLTCLEDCLISKDSLDSLKLCDFNSDNILLKGRAGAGKTTICRLLIELYPNYTIVDNIDANFVLTNNKILATTTNLTLNLSGFKSVIVSPLPRLKLLKALCSLNIKSDKCLWECINAKYPNIAKILELYTQ